MKALFVSVALLLLLAVSAYFFVLPDFFSARTKPSALEAAAVRRLRRMAIPRETRALENPVGLSTEVLAEGRAHFADHCALCHGNDGRAKTQMGPNFYPPVPDLTSGEIQSLSDGEIRYAIRNGVRFTGMPAWASEHDEDDWTDWHLVHFIRHLPKLTEQELRGMEKEPDTGAKPEPKSGQEPGGAQPHDHGQHSH